MTLREQSGEIATQVIISDIHWTGAAVVNQAIRFSVRYDLTDNEID